MRRSWSFAAAVLVASAGACGRTSEDGSGAGGTGNGTGGANPHSGGSSSGSGGAERSGGSGGTDTGGLAFGGAGEGGSDASDCDTRTKSCAYTAAEFPDVSLKDQQSWRSEVGYYCTTDDVTTWEREEQCSYSEACGLTPFAGPACVACGDYGRTTAQRLVNGTITDDCAGCGCDSWHVDLCSLDMTEYGSPYVTIRYEHDGDSFIFHVPVSLDVQTPHAGATVTASNVSYTLSPGYPVELDAVIDWTFTNSDEEGESWHIEGHVVGACPE